MRPEWTAEMQEAWDDYQHYLTITRAYARPLPAPSTTYPPPDPNSPFFWAFIFAFAPASARTDLITAAREDMLAWKRRLNPLPNLEFRI